MRTKVKIPWQQTLDSKQRKVDQLSAKSPSIKINLMVTRFSFLLVFHIQMYCQKKQESRAYLAESMTRKIGSRRNYRIGVTGQRVITRVSRPV